MKINVLYIFAGIICLIFSINGFHKGINDPQATKKWFDESIETKGKVVDYIVKKENNLELQYPVIEYYTKDGKKLTFISRLCNSSIQKLDINQEISIRYSKENNKYALLNTKVSNNAGMIIFYVMGVLFLIISILFMYLGIKNLYRRK